MWSAPLWPQPWPAWSCLCPGGQTAARPACRASGLLREHRYRKHVCTGMNLLHEEEYSLPTLQGRSRPLKSCGMRSGMETCSIRTCLAAESPAAQATSEQSPGPDISTSRDCICRRMQRVPGPKGNSPAMSVHCTPGAESIMSFPSCSTSSCMQGRAAGTSAHNASASALKRQSWCCTCPSATLQPACSKSLLGATALAEQPHRCSADDYWLKPPHKAGLPELNTNLLGRAKA
jgi:hypothetical protein